MIRKLLIVAGSALIFALLSLGGAWLAGGTEFVRYLNKGGITVDVDDDDDSGPRETRSFALDPARQLVIEAPAHVTFTRGGKAGLTVEARPAAIEALRWENGVLALAQPATGKRGGLRVTITGERMPNLELRSAGQIELIDLQQDALELTVNGAANVEASGKVDRLMAKASGAGNLDLARLQVRVGKVDIAGVGNADVSVTDTLDASISGAGNISLHRKPKVLNSSIAGIGSINEDF